MNCSKFFSSRSSSDGRYTLGEELSDKDYVTHGINSNINNHHVQEHVSWHKLIVKETFMEGQTCNATPYTTGLCIR